MPTMKERIAEQRARRNYMETRAFNVWTFLGRLFYTIWPNWWQDLTRKQQKRERRKFLS